MDKKRWSFRRVVYLILLIVLPLPALAGGPLEVRNGRALSYGKRPIVYRYDLGMLGSLNNEEAVILVEELFSTWESASSASINFKQDKPGFVDEDIDNNNFKKFLKPKSEEDLNGFTVIVFDENGLLLDEFLGTGGGNAVLGIGGPVILVKGGFHKLAESQVVLNGRFINGIDSATDREVSLDTYRRTILHEVGHAVGLDHTQINVEAIETGALQDIKDTVPLMFPRAVSDLFVLKQDDISALSLLYPASSKLQNFGQIKGKVFREDGIKLVLGANVIARNIKNPKEVAISCVSDFLKRKNGEYVIFAIPPGDYTLEIEPISTEFVSGVSAGTVGPKVGPYTKSLNDKSFQDPVPTGFYTGNNLPVNANKSDAKILEVNGNDILDGIDIIGALLQSASTDSNLNVMLKTPLTITPKGGKANVEVSVNNLLSPVKCKAFFADDLAVKMRPSEFIFRPDKLNKTVSVKLSKQAVQDILDRGLSSIEININCANGANSALMLPL